MKFHLKPYLSNLQVTDEVLIEKINACLKSEEQNKLGGNIAVKPPRVNEIYTEQQVSNSQIPLNKQKEKPEQRKE